MGVKICYAAAFVFVFTTATFADSVDWRLTATPPEISQADKDLIGRTVCG